MLTFGLSHAACHLALSPASTYAADQSGEDAKPVFAFVALKRPKVPSEQELRKAFAEFLPNEFSIEKIEVDDQGLVIQGSNCTIMAVVINRPIPWRDLEYPCQNSLLWPEATKAMKTHKSHVLVTLMGGDGTFVERNILLTKVVAAATKTFSSVGVYWGHGDVVAEPDFFRKTAIVATAKSPPVLLWVGIFPQKNRDNTISVITAGMEYFNCMEIEVIRSQSSLQQILGMVNGAAYLQLVGDTFDDGDTIGVEGNADQRIKIYHRKSTIDRKGSVLLIDM